MSLKTIKTCTDDRCIISSQIKGQIAYMIYELANKIGIRVKNLHVIWPVNLSSAI